MYLQHCPFEVYEKCFCDSIISIINVVPALYLFCIFILFSVAPQSLDIRYLNEILTLLKNGLFNESWEDIGLELGLYKPTLSKIQANYPRDFDACLRECISKWLQKADGVDGKGGANYGTLAEALEHMNQKNTADHVRSSK